MQQSAHRDLWPLQKNVRYLNHGSFGACPHKVLLVQREWQDNMERGPAHFMREISKYIQSARMRAANFLGCDSTGLVFVGNATLGTNAVLNSLPLQPGDEILVSDHGYPSVFNAAQHLSAQKGTHVKVANIPYPLQNHEQVVNAFEQQITRRTKLIVVCHVTSPTALIFPVKSLVALARSHKVPILVDGAHAAGMLNLSIDEISADFYSGTFHKWMCAPKGSGYLYVSEKYRELVHPVSISNYYGQGFLREFDWPGTVDATAWLSVPAAIDFHLELGGLKLRQRNHELVSQGAELLSKEFELPLMHPKNDKYFGSMVAFEYLKNVKDPDRLNFECRKTLHDSFGVEVQFQPFGNSVMLRISAQAYNDFSDYEALVEALKKANFAALART